MTSRDPSGCVVLRGGAWGDFTVLGTACWMIRHSWPQARLAALAFPSWAAPFVEAGWLDEVRNLHAADCAPLFIPDGEPRPELIHWLSSFSHCFCAIPDAEGTLRQHLTPIFGDHLLMVNGQVSSLPAWETFARPLVEHWGLQLPYEPVMMTLPSVARPRRDGPIRLAWHPGSGSAKKNAPLDLWLQAFESLPSLQLEIWKICGPAEDNLPPLRDTPVRLQTLRNQPVREVARWLASCHAFCGHDSGPAHLAALLGLPTLVLFGPSDARLWRPRGRHVHTLIAPGGQWDLITPELLTHALLQIVSAPPTSLA